MLIFFPSLFSHLSSLTKDWTLYLFFPHLCVTFRFLIDAKVSHLDCLWQDLPSACAEARVRVRQLMTSLTPLKITLRLKTENSSPAML